MCYARQCTRCHECDVRGSVHGVMNVVCEDIPHRMLCNLGNFRERLRMDSDEPRYRIYVVLLDIGVTEKKRFTKANPNYQIGKPCYYVGMTGKTPDERLAQHKIGQKACSYVTNYGIRLELEKFESIPLLNHADAVAMEVSHAELLRSQGYGVWQK